MRLHRLQAVLGILITAMGGGEVKAADPASDRMVIAQNDSESNSPEARLFSCLGRVYEAPEYKPLQNKLIPIGKDATFDQLSNQQKIKPSELKALRAIYPLERECTEPYLQTLKPFVPTLVSIEEAALAARDEILLQLVRRHIDWGEYALRTQKSDAIYNSQLAAEQQRIINSTNAQIGSILDGMDQERQSQRQYEQNRALIEELGRSPRPSVPHSTQTRCVDTGVVVNCRTQ